MTPAECAEYLRQYNAWRRGDDSFPQPVPKALGQIIDAAIAHLEAMGWQTIDTAPKDGTVFLCWVSAERYSAMDGGGAGIGHDVSQADFCWWNKGIAEVEESGYFDPACGQIGDSQDVTHWMPLPSAPKGKS